MLVALKAQVALCLAVYLSDSDMGIVNWISKSLVVCCISADRVDLRIIGQWA